MKFFVFILLGVALAASAQAETAVKCGETARFEDFSVTGFELQLASKIGDDYRGVAGKKWNMKIGSEDSEWLAASKNITAKTIDHEDKFSIEITIIGGRSPSGPVGTKYILDDLYSEETTLEKWNFGGVTGTVRVGTFQCVSGND